jgi:single-strand DNA-binding protein
MNKVLLKGKLGRDPETTTIGSGKSVCKFSLAVPDKFHPKDKTKTLWVNVVAWEKLGEIIQKFCVKGSEILIVGRLAINKYEKDGVKRESTTVVADELEFCGSKSDTGGGQQQPSEPDDLPF